MATRRTAAAALGLLLPGLGAAACAPAPEMQPVGAAARGPVEAFREADVNGDGVLDRHEWALLGSPTTRWEEVFGATPGEQTRFGGAATLFGDNEAFDAADEDGDRVVSREEFLAYLATGDVGSIR